MVNIVRTLLGLEEQKAEPKPKKAKRKDKKKSDPKPDPRMERTSTFKRPIRRAKPEPKSEEPSRYEEKELASKRVGDDE